MLRYVNKHILLSVVIYVFYIVCSAHVLEAKQNVFCPLSGGTGSNCGRGDHVYHSLTPERQAKCDAIIKDFAKKTQALREKVLAKQIELQAIAQSSSPERKVIQELSQEIAKLHSMLTEEYNKLYERLEKEVGVRGHHMVGSGVMSGHGIHSNEVKNSEDSNHPQAKGKKLQNRKK